MPASIIKPAKMTQISKPQEDFIYDLVELYLADDSQAAPAIVMARTDDLFDDYLQLAKAIHAFFEKHQDSEAADKGLPGNLMGYWIWNAVQEMTRPNSLMNLRLKKIRPLLVENVKTTNSWFFDKPSLQGRVTEFHPVFQSIYETLPQDERFHFFDQGGKPTVPLADLTYLMPILITQIEFDRLLNQSEQAAACALKHLNNHSTDRGRNQALVLSSSAVTRCMSSTSPLFDPVVGAAYPMPGQYVSSCVFSLLDAAYLDLNKKGDALQGDSLATLLSEHPEYVKHAMAPDLFHYLLENQDGKAKIYKAHHLILPAIKMAVSHGLDVVGLSMACKAGSWYAAFSGEAARHAESRLLLMAAASLDAGITPYLNYMLGMWHMHTASKEEILSHNLPENALGAAYRIRSDLAFLLEIKSSKARDEIMSKDLGL